MLHRPVEVANRLRHSPKLLLRRWLAHFSRMALGVKWRRATGHRHDGGSAWHWRRVDLIDATIKSAYAPKRDEPAGQMSRRTYDCD